ncbi:hypothetical protein [Bacteroides sp. 519]|uniref:hypothetical protein n=1 Tax=Bacteroides sp. 519 TaxID=2302937 RepID=UPI0013D71A3E|nr:hypothetical protein [Bacteroides sp. 519]NDV59587.1 hypothetical protein [Bacteroides sp. 519]
MRRILYLFLVCISVWIYTSCSDSEPEGNFYEDLSEVKENNSIMASWMIADEQPGSIEKFNFDMEGGVDYILPMRLTAMNKGLNLNYAVNHQALWEVSKNKDANSMIRILNDCSISLDINFEFSASSSIATIKLMRGNNIAAKDLLWTNSSSDMGTTTVKLNCELSDLKQGERIYFVVSVRRNQDIATHQVKIISSEIVAKEIFT